ncbi:MAG TPA: DUF5615 family PIN-like protein, partial [archaeon]|nr:DUF5615 family PIN-like protein [archaeon]
SDSELLKHCINTNRVLLTNDEDFLSLDKKVEHRGIIFITSQFSAIGDIIRAVVKLVDTVPEKDFKNTKFFVP